MATIPHVTKNNYTKNITDSIPVFADKFNDAVDQINTNTTDIATAQAASTAITDTNCIKATGDKVFRLGAIATEKSLPVGSTINLYGTAFTQPGTAAGVLRVHVNYRIHTTGL